MTTRDKIRKPLSLTISALMITSLATVMLLTVPLAGATATDIDPKAESVETGAVVPYVVHSDTTSGTVTVRLVVDKNKDGLYQSATDVIAENIGSGAPGGVDITIDVDTRGYADGTYTVYAAEKDAPSEGGSFAVWGEVTTTFTTNDSEAPTFDSAKTGDSATGDSSAKNKIYLQFIEDGSGLDPDTVSVDNFEVAGPARTVTGIDTVGDNYIILTLGENLATGDKPTVTYTQGVLADIKGTLVETGTKTSTDGIAPTMDSAETKTTTTIEVTFSEDLADGTVHEENFSVAGNTVTGATESAGVVTLTLENAIATDATPDVTYTKGVLADSAGNLVATTTLTPLDKVGPVLEYVNWTDVDGSGEINGGDTLEFTFSEPMTTSTVTSTNVGTALPTTPAHIYGTVPVVVWTASNVVKVTLAYSATIVLTDTVDPAESVKDAAGNIDATPAGVGIHDVSDPVILDGLRYPTIQDAIDAASSGDTIEVGTGYDSTKESFPITVNVENLTITSTGATEDTVIDAGGTSIPIDQGILNVYASNVTIEGFTIENCTGHVFTGAIYVHDSSTTLNDLIIREVPVGINTDGLASNITVENSEIRDIQNRGILLRGENAIIRNNVIDNVGTDGWGPGISIYSEGGAGGSSGTRVIENNTFQNIANDYAICYRAQDNQDLTIENNNFLSGNMGAIINEGTGNITAEYNYWGDDSGPAQAGTAVGTPADGAGAAIFEDTGAIDYDPWLTEEDGQHYDFTYVLDEGLNLVSLPLIPDDSIIGTVLGSTANVNSVWSYDDNLKSWDGYTPGLPSELTAMVDGEGYWIRIDETAENKTVLAFDGHAYVSGVEAPSAYDVYVGWNLIGFKGTTTITRVSYLGAVDGFTERCYQSPRGTYGIVENDTLLTLGYGYWLAVTEDGTIYP